MTLPRKVIGFLDLTGAWDPALAFIMVGAIAVHALAHALARRMHKPIIASAFASLTQGRVDRRLLCWRCSWLSGFLGTSMEDVTSNDLLERARAGDRSALDALLERHQTQVYRFGMKMCRDPEDAKDVLQDTLLAVARGVRDFRGQEQVRAALRAALAAEPSR